MAGAASAHQAATSTREDSSQQRAGRTRRTSADPQRAQQGATASPASAPAALDSLSRLQHLADASPQVAQLRRLQALADGQFAPVAQLACGPEEEVLVQGKFATDQLQPQLQQAHRANNTGLPDQLKSGIEYLSSLSMDHVRVHYNSAQPAQLNALAYAQGSDIHLAPGQERHLPHEAWHMVQQAQGRVRPTMQMKGGVRVNDDVGLEREADVMGALALRQNAHRAGGDQPASALPDRNSAPAKSQAVTQRQLKGDEKVGEKIKIWEDDKAVEVYLAQAWGPKNSHVCFFRNHPTKKSKEKCEKIASKLAFPITMRNTLISAEVSQTEAADIALESSAFGPLKIPDDVIGYLLELVQKHKDKYKLEVVPNKPRIKLMLSTMNDLAPIIPNCNRTKNDLKEFKELIEDPDNNYYITEIMEAMQSTGISLSAQGASGTGRGGGNKEWKTKQTERLKEELLKRIKDAKSAEIVEDSSTLHHKMSRSRFNRLLELLNSASCTQEGVADMGKFLDLVKAQTKSNDPKTALENWVANIELGVLVERRKKDDDPGEDFDGNFPNGIATPRTEQLQEVDLVIRDAISAKDVHWDKIAERLFQTHRQHEMMTKNSKIDSKHFTNPQLGQWRKNGDRYERDKPGKHSDHDLLVEDSKESNLSIELEKGVSKEIADSVKSFLNKYNYNPGGRLLVVSGNNWDCYIRCVLHHLKAIDKLDKVMNKLNQQELKIGSGVTVGSDLELKIINVIKEITSCEFYVSATDASHRGEAQSKVTDGMQVKLLLTGAHFTLIQ